MKILICEEDSARAKTLRDVLLHYKYKMVTLSKSRDILKQVQNHKPKIIIINENFTDLATKEDVLIKLRQNPVTKNIPVIFISDDPENAASYTEFKNDSMVEFMREPYKLKNLRHYIDRYTTFSSLYVKQ